MQISKNVQERQFLKGPLRNANHGFSPLKYYINQNWNEETDKSNFKITVFGTEGGCLIMEST